MFDRMPEQQNFRIAYQLGKNTEAENGEARSETIPQRFRRLVAAGKETENQQPGVAEQAVAKANTVREIPKPPEKKKLSPEELREKIGRSGGSIKEWKNKRDERLKKVERRKDLRQLAIKIVSLQNRFGKEYDWDAATDQQRYEREFKNLLKEEGLSYHQSNISQTGNRYHYELYQNGERVDVGKMFETYDDLFDYIFFNILKEVINFPAKTGQLENNSNKSETPIKDRLRRTESGQTAGDRFRNLTKNTVRQTFYIEENKI